MKRITILLLVLALALLSVQALSATSINYTIRADLIRPASNTIDSLGLGDGSASMVAKFILTSPPFFFEQFEDIQHANTFYAAPDLTITLAGNPVTVLIHPEYIPDAPVVVMENSYYSDDAISFGFAFKTASNNEYVFQGFIILPESFWSPSEFPAPLKPMSLTDTKGSDLFITRSFSNPPNDMYLVNLDYFSATLVPLPSTVWLLVSGLAGLAAAARKRYKY